MKKVNKALELDPKNTELVAQKQKLLTKATQDTKTKLVALKKAKEKADQDMANGTEINEKQYRELQREIVTTEDKLKGYETQLKSINTTNSKFSLKMQDLSSKLNGVGTKMTDVGKNMSTKLTVPLAGVGIAAGKMSMDFGKSMADINTLLDDEGHLKGYKKAVKDASNDTGIQIDVMSKGMYQAISSLGDNGKQTEKMFKTMADSARAGGAEVSDSVALISAGMKGYGDVNDNTAKKISDLAFTTAKLGVTTFPEMAQSMQPLFPLSNSLGLSMEELFGSMATLTGVTGNTSEVSTQLKAVMGGLMKPTKSMSGLIQKYGYDNAQAMIKSEGLTGVLEILQKETGGQSDKMAELFGSTEALTAMTALSGQNFDDYKEKLKKVEDSAGATGDALKKVKAPDGAKFEDSLNEMRNSLLEIGDALSPIITKVADFGSKLTEKFSKLSPEQKKLITYIGLAVAAIGPLLVAGGKVSTGISGIMDLGGKLSPKLTGFIGKTGPKLGSFFGKIGTSVMGLGTKTGGLIAKAGPKIGTFFSGVGSKIASFAVSAGGKLGTFFSGAGAKIIHIAKLFGVKGLVIGLAIAAVVTAGVLLYKNWDKIMAKAHELKEKVSEKFDQIKQKIQIVVNLIIAKWEDFKVKTKEKFQQIKHAIIQPFIDAKNKVTQKVEALKTSIIDKWNSIKSSTKQKFEDIKNAILNPINTAKDKVREKVDDIKGFFTNLKLKAISIPEPHLPKFTISGDWGLHPPRAPELGLKWHAKGGIFTSPTILPSVNGGLHGVGEAGPEAILPLSVLNGIVENAMRRVQNTYTNTTKTTVINQYAPPQQVNNLQIGADKVGTVITPTVTYGIATNQQVLKGALGV